MKNDLGNEKIEKLVFNIAIPSMIGQFVNVLYSIIDRIYIGHLADVGKLALAGVGVCGPIVTMISAFASLVGVGGAPLCSIKMGEKDNASAKKIISNAFFLLIFFSLLVMIICFPLADKMLLLFGASENTIEYASTYFKIYLIGTPFALLSIGMNNFISCQGYSKLSMFSVLIGAITNIILDPIFMFAFKMGIAGAALASIIGQFISCVFVLCILFSNRVEVPLSFDKVESKICLNILKIGMTQFLIIAFDNVMIIAMNYILKKYGGSEYGDLLISVNTILQSFMLIVTMPLSGISGGTQCILSYNFGAYKMDRVKNAYKFICKVCVGYCTIMFISIWLFGKSFILLFNNDQTVIEYCLKALHLYTIFLIPLGLQYELVDGLTGLGQVKLSFLLSFFRKSVYFIALFLIPLKFEPIYVFLAESISDLLGPLVSIFVVKRNFNHILEWRLWNRDKSLEKN